ncbi:hypothetical protein BDW60DRAFT_195506 [Aspergillus nidulans var. acristatus]
MDPSRRWLLYIKGRPGKTPLTIFSTSKDQTKQDNEIKGPCFHKIFLTGLTLFPYPT